MPGVFGDQHGGDHRLGRQPALDQPFRRRRLHHRLLAGPAGIFGTMRHDHPVLGRDHVEPLGGLLADHMHRRPTARAVGVFGRDRHVDARQMGGKRAAIGATLLGARRAPPPGPSCRRRLGRRRSACSMSSNASCSCSGSSFSERRPNCSALQLPQQMLQAIILRQRLVALGDRSVALGAQSPSHASACSAVDIGWKLIRALVHVRH